MATKSNSQELSSLVINKVASPDVYASMVSGGQINADELYLVAGDETVTYSLGQDGNTITLTGSDGSTSCVSADASGAAASAVSAHNSSASAHSDIRNAIPTATSQLTNDSGFITTGDIPEGAAASTTIPAMDGTAATGTELAFARGDHVHPTDTSRAPTSHASSTTTYGKGTSSNYGHVKLSDATNGTSAAASGGVAATPKAVSDALTSAKSYADGISANDFTDTLKSKLEGIESGAQVNTVTSVNSKTGAVSLTYSDVGAAASSHGTHVTFTTTKPVMNGTAAVGTATTVSRSDHVHPTDTSRASASDLSSHTGNTTMHITASERTAWNAKADTSDIPTKTSELTNDSGFITTGDIPEGAAASTTSPKMDGTASVGTELAFARGDHVHPTDTSRLAKSGDTMTGSLTFGGSASSHGVRFIYPTTGTTAWESTLYAHGYYGTSSDNTPMVGFSTAVVLKGIATPLGSDEAVNKGYVDSKISDFITSSDIPVTSVNSKTGAVTLTYSDVGAAPASHATSATTYGKGTTSDYGHVKLSDSTSGTATAASGGTAATPKAVADALSSAKSYADGISANDFTDTLKSKLDGIESGAQVNTVTSVNSKTGAVSLTYSDVGAAASSHGTHVTFDTSNNPAMDGTAAKGTATTVARSDHVHPTDTSRAPTSHASTSTTYGKGTGSNYGHLKLSDSTSSSSSTDGGVAATPAAVKAAYDHGGVQSVNGSTGAVTVKVTTTIDSSGNVWLVLG